MRVYISDLSKYDGKSVEVRGWVYRKRESKGIVFLIIRDSSGVVQTVAKEGIKDFPAAQSVSRESSVILTGKIREDKRAPGGHELDVDSFNVVGPAEEFPIGKDVSPEFLLDVRHLSIRDPRMSAIFRIRSEVFGAIHEHFRKSGFYEIQSPSITSAACEGGSTLFPIKYFDEKAYLTQSWQLYAEAMIASLEKIYCIAPSFRAEKSRTRRHLAEYWHAEAEAAWVDHQGNMKTQEGLVWNILQRIATNRAGDLKLVGRDPKELLKMKPPFKRVTYEKAFHILEEDGVQMDWKAEFGAEHERILSNHFNKPFFVTEFPAGAKAFYMKLNPKNPEVVLCDDMIAPEGFGELIGGSERETDIAVLKKMLKAQGTSPKAYEWYFDTRRFGTVPHSGFGMGVERIIMWACKLEHIRDAIAFPRTINRLCP
ncbi:MAG: asparagine--tRNA ligase [Candidatus Aenigmatarchaeota archaeon]